MDHPAGPCHCWYRGGGLVGVAVGGREKGEERMLARGMMREGKRKMFVGGEGHGMKGRCHKTNLAPASDQQRQQITTITPKKIAQEACRTAALWVSEGVCVGGAGGALMQPSVKPCEGLTSSAAAAT